MESMDQNQREDAMSEDVVWSSSPGGATGGKVDVYGCHVHTPV